MNRSALLFTSIAAALLLTLTSGISSSAAEPGVPAAPIPKTEETNAQDILRSYLQLQEQLHEAQLAIEQSRKDAKESAAKTTEELTAQLKAIETALGAQRARELEAMQSSNKVMLVMAGIFAALGFLAMVLMAYFQWRTVHGLAEISIALPDVRNLSRGRAVAALQAGDLEPLSAAAAQSKSRLLGALEQLEQRIYGLERANRPALNAETREQNGASGGNGESHNEPGLTDPADPVKCLLVKGQQLLDEDQPAAALDQFEKALGLAAGHPEALVKKGSALERLGQFDQAIGCYDQAIAADSSFTVAFLHKGGLFNRLEKFSEALDCYEKALRTKEKRDA